MSSVEEARRRVHEAEARVANGEYLTEDEFWNKVDKHLDKL